MGLPTPVYETIKEGPSHEPTFHSTVIVNDVRYNSLPGFSNRKAAEQSAAEVALMELSKSSDLNPHVSQPVVRFHILHPTSFLVVATAVLFFLNDPMQSPLNI